MLQTLVNSHISIRQIDTWPATQKFDIFSFEINLKMLILNTFISIPGKVRPVTILQL